MKDRLTELILNFRSNGQIASFDEATTKQTVILRLLSALGWNIFDAEETKPEYSVTAKRVDYALRLNSSNKVFLEVKKPVEELESHQEQLLQYAFQEGVKLAVLTNGTTWWFYLPLNEGSWEQRRFYAIDILQQEPEDVAAKFMDFLSRENVKSEMALRKATEIYQGNVRDNEIKKSMPRAWNKIVSEPDGLLVDLLLETLEKICGYRAEEKQVKRFLSENAENLSIVDTRRSFKLNTRSIHTGTSAKGHKRTPSRDFPPNGTICRFSYKGTSHEGEIKNGEFLVKGLGAHKSFSSASKAITKTSRDGWRDWELRLPGSTHWILADTWRESQKISKKS
jgi:predicted type IV restriction endonuclease